MLILRWRVPKSLQFSLQISRNVDFFEDFSQKVYKTAEMKTFLQTFAVPHPDPLQHFRAPGCINGIKHLEGTHMKRILAAVLTAVMAVSLMGCAGAGNGKSHKSTGSGTIPWLNAATAANIENLKKNDGKMLEITSCNDAEEIYTSYVTYDGGVYVPGSGANGEVSISDEDYMFSSSTIPTAPRMSCTRATSTTTKTCRRSTPGSAITASTDGGCRALPKNCLRLRTRSGYN